METPGIANTTSLPAGLPNEPELFCYNCDYNLAGLTQDRCPECGRTFNRDQLVKWATEPRQPLPFGLVEDDAVRRLLIASFFHPRRLGRQLPPHANLLQLHGLTFISRVVLGLSALAISGLALAIAAGDSPVARNGVTIFIVAMAVETLIMIVGFRLAELAIARLLTLLVEPRAVPKNRGRFRFWYSLTLCFGGFSLASLVGISLLQTLLLAVGKARTLNLPAGCVAFAAGAAVLIWWWRCLALAVSARAVGGWRTGLAICLLPLVGIMAFAAPLLAGILAFRYRF